MKAFVNAGACNGCGFCARMVSGIFLIRDNGKAFALNVDIPDDYAELARVAADECPRMAIELFDDRMRQPGMPFKDGKTTGGLSAAGS